MLRNAMPDGISWSRAMLATALRTQVQSCFMMRAQAAQPSWNPGRIMVRAVYLALLRAMLKCRIPMCIELKLGAESNTMISKDGQ
jgi:hypothetical protein